MQPYSAPFVLVAALAGALLPVEEARAAQQQPELVSYSTSRSSQRQILALEFADGGEMSIAFDDGVVTVNGETIGRYEPDGDAFRTWGDLLAGVSEASEGGSVARELADWSPDEPSSEAAAELLGRIDRLLERALAGEMELPVAETSAARSDAESRQARLAAEISREAARAAFLTEATRTRATQETHRETRARIREMEAELARLRRSANRPEPWTRALREVAHTAGDMLQTLLQFLLACGAALLLTRYAGDRVDRVANEAAERPVRAVAVGFAGGVLFVPALILGIAALAVTVVGVILVPFWVLLFPLAVFLAGFLGYVGVSHNVGRWVLDQDLPWLARIDRSRPTHVRLTGLGALAVPFAAAPLLGAIPFAGWLGPVVWGAGSLLSAFAMMAGLGAAILTRGGREGSIWRRNGLEEEFEAAWSPDDIGDDDLAGDAAPRTDSPASENAPDGESEGGS